MRWPIMFAPERRSGTKRDVRRFAFLPTICDEDGDRATVVWLSWYIAQQEWMHSGYAMRWVTIARYTPEPF